MKKPAPKRPSAALYRSDPEAYADQRREYDQHVFSKRVKMIERQERLLDWAEKNLTVGTRVQYSGTKDAGFREIFSIGKRRPYKTNPINSSNKDYDINHTMIYCQNFQLDHKGNPTFITENQLTKLKSVRVDGEWISVKGIIDAQERR